MWKKVKTILLSTNEPSYLFRIDKKKLSFTTVGGRVHKTDIYQPQHLYILSDEEIKIGDIVIERLINDSYQLFTIHTLNDIDKENQKKVIASTDKSLNLPQPTDEFIQKWIDTGCPEEIEVEYEEKSFEDIQRDLDTYGHDEGLVQSEYDEYLKHNSLYTLLVNNDTTINCRLIEYQNILEDLKAYFRETPREQVLKTWAEAKEEAPKGIKQEKTWDDIGEQYRTKVDWTSTDFLTWLKENYNVPTKK